MKIPKNEVTPVKALDSGKTSEFQSRSLSVLWNNLIMNLMIFCVVFGDDYWRSI